MTARPPSLSAHQSPMALREGGRSLRTRTSGSYHPARYGSEAQQTQADFLDRHLRQRDVPPQPVVKLEIREGRDGICAVRAESSWPLERTRWTPLHLTNIGLSETPGAINFNARRSGARFDWTVPADTELTARCRYGCSSAWMATTTTSSLAS